MVASVSSLMSGTLPVGSDKTPRFTIGLWHAPCETQAGRQRTELGDRRVDTLAEFARLESTDSALGVTPPLRGSHPASLALVAADGRDRCLGGRLVRCDRMGP